MEDLLYLLIAVLFSVCYNPMTKPIPQPVTLRREIESSIIRESNVITNSTAQFIKQRLIEIYNSDSENKREKIIGLLLQLNEVEDTDIFFEKNDYIRSYIFNSA